MPPKPTALCFLGVSCTDVLFETQQKTTVRSRFKQDIWAACLGAGGQPATFVHVIEVGLLAHGGQEVQDTGVEADLVITAVFPGVVLDHVEKLSNKEQDPVFRMILEGKQNRTNNPRHEAGERKQSRQKPRSRPLVAVEKFKWQLWLNQQRKVPQGRQCRSSPGPRAEL